MTITGPASGSEETILQTKHGLVKFHSRPNTAGYGVELKTEPTDVSGTHFGMEATIDHKPTTATSALGVRGLGAICRLAATYTMTGGSLVGSYAQICNLGTLNGAGIIGAAQYSLIEDGGTYTAVSHLAISWLDSHLAQTVSAGSVDMQYMTNNGSTTFDNVFYIYAGNKVTNLFTIDTASGLVSAATTADYTFNKYYRIKVNVGGETAYLIADVPA
jgi:hypothetical protein